MSRKKKKQALLLGLTGKKEKSQALDFSNKSSYSNIYIVIGKPMNSEYYHISINEVNNSELVNRDRVINYLSDFIKDIGKYNLQRFLSHFKSFIILIENEEIHELENEEESFSVLSELHKEMIKKEKKDYKKRIIDYFQKVK